MAQDRARFLKSAGKAALYASAAGLLPCGAAAASGARILRLGHWVSTSSPHHVFAVRFADLVAQKTHGALEIMVFPRESLGNNVQQVEAQQSGTLDFSLPTSAALARIDPTLLVLTLPYLFGSSASALEMLDGPVGRAFFDGLPARGVRVLAYSSNGVRNVTNSVRPVYRPEDLSGLRIRVPSNGVAVALFRSFGALPVAMSFAQVFGALHRHRIDGQENPFINIYTGKFYDVQRYISTTKHQFEALALTVSERTWLSFDRATQRAVGEAAHEATAFHRQLFAAADLSAQGRLQELGMHFARPDIAAFKSKSRPLYSQLATLLSPDLVARVEHAAST